MTLLGQMWYRAKTGVRLNLGPIALMVRAGPSSKISSNSSWKRSRRWATVNGATVSTIDHGGAAPQASAFQYVRSAKVPGSRTLPQVALIVGVGLGLGAALARRFSSAGMDIALASRNIDKLSDLVKECRLNGHRVFSYGCDASYEPSVRELFTRLHSDLGTPQLVVYNCESFGPGGILETNPHAFERCWRVNCFGAFLVARATLPPMLDRATGTIIFTGPTGSLRGRQGFVNLAVGKAGARMLAQSMAREFGPKGVHVAHVVIDGPILTPKNADVVEERGIEGLLDPDAIAESLYQLYLQPKTAWTHELDLRPWVESF